MGKIPILSPKVNEPTEDPISSLFSVDGVDDFSELTRHASTRQMEDDLVTAMDVDQVFSNWQDATLHHPETGFLSRQGRDAMGLYEAFQEEAERKFLELNDGLDNVNQRALFEARFQEQLQWSQSRIAAHEAREVDLHRRTTLGEASFAESRRAVERMNEGDAVGAEEAMDLATRFLEQSLSGMPQDERDEAQSMLVSGYHGDVFKRQLEVDPLRAVQYVFRNQKTIRPDIYEHLRQTAEQKFEKVEGRTLFESVYEPDAELESLFQSIDASDAPEQQKSIARELVEDRKAVDQAEQIAFEKQQISMAEDAAISAVHQIDQGTAFDQVPDDVISQLTPEHRKAVRAVYLQKLSGEAAPPNAKLELELHESWFKFVNGESDGFLELPLASQYGTHSRTRLDLWIERQAQLNRGDPRILAELARRKFAFNKATAFIAEAVNQRMTDPATQTRMQGQLNEAAITYINHWHESNLGKMMEPKVLVDMLEVMVGPLPLEPENTMVSKSASGNSVSGHGVAVTGLVFGVNSNTNLKVPSDPVKALANEATVDGYRGQPLKGGVKSDILQDIEHDDTEIAMGAIRPFFQYMVKKYWRPKIKIKKGKDRYKRTNDGEFVQFDDGKIDFKGIDSETALKIAREAASIRLRRGQHDDETDKGEGETHIEARHWEQIRKFVDENGKQKFEDVADYVHFVSENWTEIRDNGSGRLVMVVRDNTDFRSDTQQNVMILGLEKTPSVDFYDVKTAGPFTNRRLKKMELLIER